MHKKKINRKEPMFEYETFIFDIISNNILYQLSYKFKLMRNSTINYLILNKYIYSKNYKDYTKIYLNYFSNEIFYNSLRLSRSINVLCNLTSNMTSNNICIYVKWKEIVAPRCFPIRDSEPKLEQGLFCFVST